MQDTIRLTCRASARSEGKACEGGQRHASDLWDLCRSRGVLRRGTLDGCFGDRKAAPSNNKQRWQCCDGMEKFAGKKGGCPASTGAQCLGPSFRRTRFKTQKHGISVDMVPLPIRTLKCSSFSGLVAASVRISINICSSNLKESYNRSRRFAQIERLWDQRMDKAMFGRGGCIILPWGPGAKLCELFQLSYASANMLEPQTSRLCSVHTSA